MTSPRDANILEPGAPGAGLERPRVFGAFALAAAAVAILLNVATAALMNEVYLMPLALGGFIAPAGLWLLATGEPRDRGDGTRAPLWGRVGLGVALAAGLVIAVVLVIEV
jgi:hypothetical protein